jgi:hypothetical protein
MPVLRADTVVMCDDIRREVGGKATLVGAYGHVMRVSGFPENSEACWYLLTTASEAGDHVLDFRITGPNDSILFQGEIALTVRPEALRGTLTVGKISFQIQQPGVIRVEWADHGRNNWEMIKDIEIRQRKGPDPRQASSTKAEISLSTSPPG